MRTDMTRRQAALLYTAVLVAFFGGTWVLDRLWGTAFHPDPTVGMALCLVAGWWTARRMLFVLARRAG